MFVLKKTYKEKVRDLEEQLKVLQARVYVVETDCAPFRIGQYPPGWSRMSYDDPRPQVTLRTAIEFIRERLKLEFRKIDSVPERIELVKVEAKR